MNSPEGDVSETNYQWKFKWASKTVEIFPDDVKFSIGVYRVLMVNRDEDEDEFTY